MVPSAILGDELGTVLPGLPGTAVMLPRMCIMIPSCYQSYQSTLVKMRVACRCDAANHMTACKLVFAYLQRGKHYCFPLQGVDQSSYGCRWFIPSLVQVLAGCCVLTSCSVTLAGAPVTLLCCLVLYG